MSIRVMAKVWESGLPSEEKFVCLAMADFANDNGDSIFPSIAYVSWKCGKGERATQRALKALRDRGVLEPLRGLKGGRAQTVHYRLHVDRLPVREPWRNPVPSTGFGNERVSDTTQKGVTIDGKSRRYDTRSVSDPREEPLASRADAFSVQRRGRGTPDDNTPYADIDNL